MDFACNQISKRSAAGLKMPHFGPVLLCNLSADKQPDGIFEIKRRITERSQYINFVANGIVDWQNSILNSETDVHQRPARIQNFHCGFSGWLKSCGVDNYINPFDSKKRTGLFGEILKIGRASCRERLYTSVGA